MLWCWNMAWSKWDDEKWNYLKILQINSCSECLFSEYGICWILNNLLKSKKHDDDEDADGENKYDNEDDWDKKKCKYVVSKKNVKVSHWLLLALLLCFQLSPLDVDKLPLTAGVYRKLWQRAVQQKHNNESDYPEGDQSECDRWALNEPSWWSWIL